MAHLHLETFDSDIIAAGNYLNLFKSILNWGDQVAHLTVEQALRSDFKGLLEPFFQEISNSCFDVRLYRLPTPILNRHQGLNPMGASPFRSLAIQSGRNRWGCLEFEDELLLERASEATLTVALRLIAERLDWAQERERLGSALNRLSHVAGAAVHEVRNPLTSLRLQLHLLDRLLRGQGDASRLLVSDMEAEMQRISGHLEDLSLLTQLKAGRFSLAPAKVDLVASIRDVVGRYARLFELRKTTCTFTSQAQEIIGSWDVFRIEQVVGNLLSNAWKYGDSKPVEVSIEVQETDPVSCFSRTCGSKSCCVIRVKDQGRGMDAEAASRVFEGFFRAQEAAHQPGTGLGLYISLNILKAMGGTLTVQSKIGEGSEFIASIPRNI